MAVLFRRCSVAGFGMVFAIAAAQADNAQPAPTADELTKQAGEAAALPIFTDS